MRSRTTLKESQLVHDVIVEKKEIRKKNFFSFQIMEMKAGDGYTRVKIINRISSFFLFLLIH